MINVNDVSMHYPCQRSFINMLLMKERLFNKAIRNISFKINEGDSVGFLGVNGAGKTTLLKLIGGLLYPTKGSISINGLNTVDENDKCRSSIGYVLNEDRSFYWRLTGMQNLAFFGALNNMHNDSFKNQANKLIKLVGLDYAIHKRVSGYSAGMRQRLAIARGLLGNPDVLILDEPTKSLDPNGALELRELVYNEIHKTHNKTLLIATHQISEAEKLCNKVCIIINGNLLLYETLDNIIMKFGDLNTCYQKVAQAAGKTI